VPDRTQTRRQPYKAIPGWKIKVRDDRTSTDGLVDDLRYKAFLSELKLPE